MGDHPYIPLFALMQLREQGRTYIPHECGIVRSAEGVLLLSAQKKRREYIPPRHIRYVGLLAILQAWLSQVVFSKEICISSVDSLYYVFKYCIIRTKRYMFEDSY